MADGQRIAMEYVFGRREHQRQREKKLPLI
jgi:hypothetical protein